MIEIERSGIQIESGKKPGELEFKIGTNGEAEVIRFSLLQGWSRPLIDLNTPDLLEMKKAVCTHQAELLRIKMMQPEQVGVRRLLSCTTAISDLDKIEEI